MGQACRTYTAVVQLCSCAKKKKMAKVQKCKSVRTEVHRPIIITEHPALALNTVSWGRHARGLPIERLPPTPLGGRENCRGHYVWYCITCAQKQICAPSRAAPFFDLSFSFEHHSCALHPSGPSFYGESLSRSQPLDPGNRTQDTGEGSAWSESPLGPSIQQFQTNVEKDLNPSTTNRPWPISSHGASPRSTAVLMSVWLFFYVWLFNRPCSFVLPATQGQAEDQSASLSSMEMVSHGNHMKAWTWF